jgi:hypothetical protein
MRISATSANAAMRDAPAARRAGSGIFSLGDGANAAARAGAGQLQAIAGIDALVALQGVDDPAERRRRAVRGGRAALDALDALKLALVSGSLDLPAVNRLKAAAAELAADSGDRELDSVLAEIDLRLQVEIAKLSRS